MGVGSEYRKEGGAVLYGLWHQWYLGWKLPVPLLLNSWIWLNDKRLAMKSRQAVIAQTKSRNLPRVIQSYTHPSISSAFSCSSKVLFCFVYIRFPCGLSFPITICPCITGRRRRIGVAESMKSCNVRM